MSGIVGSRFNHKGSGLVGSLGTDGQVFTSAGAGKSAVYEDAAGGMGSLIATATASDSSSLDFTSGITSSYSMYLFVMCDVDLSAQAAVYAQLYRDGAYVTSGYEAAGTEINDGSSWLKIYGSKSAIFCAYADSDEPAGANHNMRVWLYNPASVTSFQTVAVLADYYNSNGSVAKAYITSGLKSDYDEAITGIKFYPSSGNFETGTVRMYGYNAT